MFTSFTDDFVLRLEYTPKLKADESQTITTRNISWTPGDYRKYIFVKNGEKIGEQSAKVERQLVYENEDAWGKN